MRTIALYVPYTVLYRTGSGEISRGVKVFEHAITFVRQLREDVGFTGSFEAGQRHFGRSWTAIGDSLTYGNRPSERDLYCAKPIGKYRRQLELVYFRSLKQSL